MTVSGQIFKDIADAIREKEGTTELMTLQQMPQRIRNIETGGGGGKVEPPSLDVDFIDYDGTILYSYTKQQALQLTELPPFAEHEGLVCDGWNWTLGELQSYIAKYDYACIGLLYHTDDNSMRFYIHIDKNIPPFRIAILGTASIRVDMGDGTIYDIPSPGSTATSSTLYTPYHTYSVPGNYVIKLSKLSTGTFYISSSSTTITTKLFEGGNGTEYECQYIINRIYKIELPTWFIVNSNDGFSGFGGVEAIAIPNVDGNYFNLKGYYQLKAYVMPRRKTLSPSTHCISLRRYAPSPVGGTSFVISESRGIKKICVPEGYTTLSGKGSSTDIRYQFQCANKITIPETISTINSYAIPGYTMVEVDLSHHTTIPKLSSNNFGNATSLLQIIVPDELYDSWIVATNWSASAVVSHIVKKSESRKYGGSA